MRSTGPSTAAVQRSKPSLSIVAPGAPLSMLQVIGSRSGSTAVSCRTSRSPSRTVALPVAASTGASFTGVTISASSTGRACRSPSLAVKRKESRPEKSGPGV